MATGEIAQTRAQLGSDSGRVETRGRKEEISSGDILTVLGQTRTVVEAAGVLGCSAPEIHWRGRKESAVAKALSEQVVRREEELARLLMEHRGNVSRVAEVMDVTPYAIRYHISRSPRLRQLWEDSRETLIDRAEANIFDAVEGGNLSYSWKILQTLGKNRGYTERREVDSVVTHKVDALPTGRLVEMLDSMAVEEPELLEAEFSELSDEDRGVLGSLLQEHAQDAELVEA